MTNWATAFLILALICALFGFTGGLATNAAWARLFFNLFLVMFLVSAFRSMSQPPVS